jgi:ribosome biogenesis protein ERB1
MAVTKKVKETVQSNPSADDGIVLDENMKSLNIDSEVDEVSTDQYTSSDDSEDEVILNRSGNVPGTWYEDTEHRGYDVYGKKVVKTLTSSKIAELLKNAADPDRWRTVQDLQNEREVYLTDADIEIIRRLRSGCYTDGNMNEEDYFLEFDDTEHKLHPVRNKDFPKSRFLAISKEENKEVRRLVKLIRAGKIKPGQRPPRSLNKSTEPVFDLWAQGDEESNVRGPAHLPAPKMPLPGHAESYRPPEEYLFTEEEKAEWEAGDDSVRKSTFIPDVFPSLRRVPWYDALITERFNRCLDLYTVPRQLKKKMNIDPESLIPQLPKIEDLRPFPTTLSVEYIGHEEPVTGVYPAPSGDWLASTSSDSLRVWDVLTGKCIWESSSGNVSVAWHPMLPILAVGDEEGTVRFIGLRELVIGSEMDHRIDEVLKVSEDDKNWKSVTADEVTFTWTANTPISSLSWHPKGNFIVAVSSSANSGEKSCCVISVVNKKFVTPLKGKGQATGTAKHVIFHPSKPYLVVAGTSNIAIFDLKSQHRVKTLASNSNTISSVAVHPAAGGSHVIATTLDCKVVWFDTEVRDKPWKNFRHHTSAVRRVVVHPLAGGHLPLMASVGDDKAAHVLHARVYDDQMKNPLVVPVKKLNHPSNVSDCQWHPSLPWLFTACADGTVRLWA